MSENVTNEENTNKKIVGFKVSAYEYNVLQQYAQIFHNQMVQDPETKNFERSLLYFLDRYSFVYTSTRSS
jgi:hypothetical protein